MIAAIRELTTILYQSLSWRWVVENISLYLDRQKSHLSPVVSEVKRNWDDCWDWWHPFIWWSVPVQRSPATAPTLEFKLSTGSTAPACTTARETQHFYFTQQVWNADSTINLTLSICIIWPWQTQTLLNTAQLTWKWRLIWWWQADAFKSWDSQSAFNLVTCCQSSPVWELQECTIR